MLDIRSLKAEMVRNRYTQESLAKEIGVTSRTFSNRLKTGNFSREEISIMIKVLKLKNPMDIFFAQGEI